MRSALKSTAESPMHSVITEHRGAAPAGMTDEAATQHGGGGHQQEVSSRWDTFPFCLGKLKQNFEVQIIHTSVEIYRFSAPRPNIQLLNYCHSTVATFSCCSSRFSDKSLDPSLTSGIDRTWEAHAANLRIYKKKHDGKKNVKYFFLKKVINPVNSNAWRWTWGWKWKLKWYF